MLGMDICFFFFLKHTNSLLSTPLKCLEPSGDFCSHC